MEPSVRDCNTCKHHRQELHPGRRAALYNPEALRRCEVCLRNAVELPKYEPDEEIMKNEGP